MPRAAAIPADSTEVILRPVDRDDIPAITAIYRQAVLDEAGTFETVPPDETEMASRLAKVVEQGCPFLVAGAPGRVLGYAYAAPFRLRPAYRFTLEDSVYVGASERGRGVGRALLDALITESTARKFRQIVAVIGDSANRGSIELHARAGFTHAGVLGATGWKHERWLDVVLMQRPLGAGSGSPAT